MVPASVVSQCHSVPLVIIVFQPWYCSFDIALSTTHTSSMTKTSDHESKMIEKWKAALANPPKPYVSLGPKIPPSFTLVSKAGSGVAADAFFCLLRDAVTDEETPEPDQAPAKASRLMGKLQVVKLFARPEPMVMGKEIAILDAIKVQRPEHESTHPFFEVTAFDPAGYWYATSTLPMCCELGAMKGSFKYLPEEFMWLVFLQIRKALGFLHEKCDPLIAHADLHMGNVLICFSGPTDQGMPKIKLIDFGFSVHVPASRRDQFLPIKDDVHGLLKIMDCIIHDYGEWNRDSCEMYLRCGAPEARSSTFHSFHKAVNDNLVVGDRICSLSNLSQQFGRYAARKATSIPDANVAQIRDAVRKATYPRFQSMEKTIQKLLNPPAPEDIQTPSSKV
jgi:hypothetical protein